MQKENIPEDEIKKNYKALIKENHPDLFPEQNRYEQNLITMEINEAYLNILNNNPKKASWSGQDENNKDQYKKTYPGTINYKDPAFAFYKAGCDHFYKGRDIFKRDRYLLKNTDKCLHTDSKVLEAAMSALNEFIVSFRYFKIVKDRYYQSEWCNDAVDKLDELSRFNDRYSKIISNMQAKTYDRFNRSGV